MKTDTKLAAARSFIRSLNILLKFVRLYGLEHTRSAEQFRSAWTDLRTAILEGDQTGLMLGASGSQLILDGAPIETSAAERSFAQLLSAAGLASIHFLPNATKQELARFVQAFPTGNVKASVLADQLRSALENAQGIKINEMRYVAEDAAGSEMRAAASLMVKTLGSDSRQVKAWLNDPQKLLQLIAAAEGSHSGSSENVGGARGGSGASGSSPASSTGSAFGSSQSGAAESVGVQDEEIMGVLRLLSSLGRTAGGKEGLLPGAFEQEISKVSDNSRGLLRQALATLAAQGSAVRSGDPMLLRLAEHLAIRFALDRYEKGDVRVNAVRQLLERMSQEIGSLRQILGAHEEKMADAGMMVESHSDLMDRQFWAAVPESGKRSVLLSPDAWCIPPRNVRQYIEELRRRDDHATSSAILENYATAIGNEDAAARRRASIGLVELAELYGTDRAQALIAAIRITSVQLSLEREDQLQALVTAAFVRLVQEAATRNSYRALLQAIDLLEGIENQRPAFGDTVRPRLGLEKRLPDFIEDAIRSSPTPDGLIDLIERMPQPAVKHLVARFNRVSSRVDSQAVVQVVKAIGQEAMANLRETLLTATPGDAAEVVGLLCRLDPGAAGKYLVSRLRDWPRSAQDRALRLVAASGSEKRGWLLLSVFEQFESMLQPLAADEIGMSSGTTGAERLVRIAAGDLPAGASPLLRIKAIEALGRLQMADAAPVLREILETKKMWRWLNHTEMRISAFHAMCQIDPDWAAGFLPHSGLAEHLEPAPRDGKADTPWFRQRRYSRIKLNTPVPATASFERQTVPLQIRALNLSGGLASAEKHITPGTLVSLRIGSSLRSMHAQAFVRGARAQALSFEFADMDLEERSRLRQFLQENGATVSIARAPEKQVEAHS